MKNAIFAVFLLLLRVSGFAQITQAQIAAAYEANQLPALLERIKAQPAEARRSSVEEMAKLMAAEYNSGREYHNGAIYMENLLEVADDDQLARILRPYLDSGSFNARERAFGVLSRGRGVETGNLMAQRIGKAFDGLPTSSPPKSEEISIRESESYIQLCYCLTGLLLSESKEARLVGLKYLRLTRQKYSSDEQGRRRLKAIEDELKRDGIVVPDIEPDTPQSAPTTDPSSPPPSPAESTAPQLASPSVSDSEFMKSRKYPRLMWVALLVFLVLISLALRNRMR